LEVPLQSLKEVSPAGTAFPNGNREEVILVGSDGSFTPYRIDPDKSKYALLIAQPHPYRDVSRLQIDYDRIPSWLFYANEFLASNAVAVIQTYPPDVDKISTHLLAVLGFEKPYHVLPVSPALGTQVDHSQVLLVARRSHGIEDLSPLERYGVLPSPVEVGKLLAPTATSAFFLFPPNNFHLDEDWIGNRLGITAVSGWDLWEE
jgi:hypothetical protein